MNSRRSFFIDTALFLLAPFISKIEGVQGAIAKAWARFQAWLSPPLAFGSFPIPTIASFQKSESELLAYAALPRIRIIESQSVDGNAPPLPPLQDFEEPMLPLKGANPCEP